MTCVPSWHVAKPLPMTKKKPKKKMSGKCSFFFAWKPDLGLSFIFNIYNTNSKVEISPFSQDDKVCFPVKKILWEKRGSDYCYCVRKKVVVIFSCNLTGFFPEYFGFDELHFAPSMESFGFCVNRIHVSKKKREFLHNIHNERLIKWMMILKKKLISSA